MTTTSDHPRAVERIDTTGVVLDVFRSVFHVEDVRPEDSFLDLGGASLQAAEIGVSLRERLGVSVGILFLFDHPTAGEVVAEVEAQLTGR